jgi:hypothetical protein
VIIVNWPIKCFSIATRNRFDLEYDRQILEFEAAQWKKEGFKQRCAERSGPTIDMMAGKYHDCLRISRA